MTTQKARQVIEAHLKRNYLAWELQEALKIAREVLIVEGGHYPIKEVNHGANAR